MEELLVARRSHLTEIETGPDRVPHTGIWNLAIGECDTNHRYHFFGLFADAFLTKGNIFGICFSTVPLGRALERKERVEHRWDNISHDLIVLKSACQVSGGSVYHAAYFCICLKFSIQKLHVIFLKKKIIIHICLWNGSSNSHPCDKKHIPSVPLETCQSKFQSTIFALNSRPRQDTTTAEHSAWNT